MLKRWFIYTTYRRYNGLSQQKSGNSSFPFIFRARTWKSEGCKMMIWNNWDMWVTDHSTIFNWKITSLCSNKSSLFQLPPFRNLPIGPESLSSVPPGAVADTGATGNDGSCQNDCQENDGSNSMEILANLGKFLRLIVFQFVDLGGGRNMTFISAFGSILVEAVPWSTPQTKSLKDTRLHYGFEFNIFQHLPLPSKGQLPYDISHFLMGFVLRSSLGLQNKIRPPL